jgi:hypothetical protein
MAMTSGASAHPAVDAMLPEPPESYQKTLDTLVERVQAARVCALRSVNQELVLLYWDIGQEILLRQEREGWGSKVIDRLARDLRSQFPDMGMSPRNLKYMRAFAKAWPNPENVQGGPAQSLPNQKVPQPWHKFPGASADHQEPLHLWIPRLDEQATEREVEHGLMAHVERFLQEMERLRTPEAPRGLGGISETRFV